ncbi:hypothetical protein [Staphylococcus pettenkoferi]|uniref:hypothetical protein n=1 Tax=Staphylococcus pettenkoferi TaxID=170573 RepID=UPI00119E133F|nr:hypothetical protein [Staphylococcus pettenkoferi]MCY1627323.1 hypothetical protein [Staphylococcus pettenkoferi]
MGGWRRHGTYVLRQIIGPLGSIQIVIGIFGVKWKCILLKTSMFSHEFEYVRLECSMLTVYETFNQTKKPTHNVPTSFTI